MNAAEAAERLTAELLQQWEANPKVAQALLCRPGEDDALVQVVAPPVKKKWLTSTDVELFAAEPPDAATSVTWHAAVDQLRTRGWASEGYEAPLIWAAPQPGRSPELARWAVDELLVALEVGYGVSDPDGLHWNLG